MAPTMGAPVTSEAKTTASKNEFVQSDREKAVLFRSKLPDIDISNTMNLAHYSFQKASENLDRIAMVDGVTGQQWTYRETELLSRKVAVGLTKLGVEQNEVIALLLPNCAEFVIVFLGSATRGSVVTTCNPFYTEREITKQLTACKAKLIVTHAACVDKVRGLDAKIIVVDTPPPGTLPISVLFDNDENDVPKVQVDADDVVCLPFSSGTTGLPKGVMLTHRNLISSVAQQVDGQNPHFNIRNDDAIMCLLPMFHIYSLNSILLCALRACATIVIMPKYTIPQLLELIQRYRITVLPVVPPVVQGLARSPIVSHFDVSSLKLVMSGSAPLGKDLENALHAKLPGAVLGQGYGMTEAGPVLCMSLAFAKTPFAVKSGSCGTVVRNADMKIVDPETGLSLSYNQPGEIHIRGPQIMKGYWNNPEATALAIDEEGWLRTGDIAYIDEDQEVFIVDRVKEIIKFKGFQVPPAELEAILFTHPSIADAAVVGKKDERAGEVPIAFVVRSPDVEPITEDLVKEFVANQVVFYKKLHSVLFIDAIPKNPSGKILRKDLRPLLL